MKRSTALILATFLDIFFLVAVYLLIYRPLKDVLMSIANHSDFIRYNTTFFIALAGVFFPVMHCMGFIETYLPRYYNRSVCTKVMWCSVVVPLIIGLGAANWVKQEILQHGYVHCAGADTHMKLAHFKVYVREMDTCRQLTMEKKNHNRAGLKAH
jgi:hypothetical protein